MKVSASAVLSPAQTSTRAGESASTQMLAVSFVTHRNTGPSTSRGEISTLRSCPTFAPYRRPPTE
ncbi:hypothetical protein GCM10022220_60660 [Actinocatenispora rupis]|uniref:Uncharacterized protein n=1 Tax=Actinocatenispora rupis TaxID=519421 RepID=A0A8J3JBF0_9ACTN|nr:hypothetical protein Aru02nite_61900 [Actinocatenispora rupis]